MTATKSWSYPVTAGRNFLLLKQQPGPGCFYQVVYRSPNVSCSTVTKDSWVAERSICKSELSIDSDRTYWLKLVQKQKLVREKNKWVNKVSHVIMTVRWQMNNCEVSQWVRVGLTCCAFSLGAADHHDYVSNKQNNHTHVPLPSNPSPKCSASTVSAVKALPISNYFDKL